MPWRRTYTKIEEACRPTRLRFLLPLFALGLTVAAQGQPVSEEGVEVLTRGPIHEAFAEASMSGSKAGLVVPKSPYDPIAELPPEQRPEGRNIEWIPGYWSWDDDRDDFIWCSGVWRDLPPGRQWVPGYWASVGSGSQWISGFWGEVGQSEVTYLPAPPEPLEVGPSSPLPGQDHIWTPGSWIWQTNNYNWQPGYWMQQQPNWVWTPSRYTWTPRGYVYVPGYWDHELANRGVMFAPVYYQQPVYRRPDYYYSPNTVISIGAILAYLFVQPRSNHYYYGDYYDTRYQDRGIYPWHSRQLTRYGGNPIYTHYRSSQLRRDPDWDRYMNNQYRYRRDHVEARPPRTLALQVNFINNNNRASDADNFVIGRSLTEAVQSNTQPHRFRQIGMDERRQIETRGRGVYKLQQERASIETPATDVDRPRRTRDRAEPVRVKLPASPVAAKQTESVAGANAPPPIPVAPRAQAPRDRDRRVKPAPARAKTETPRPPVTRKIEKPKQPPQAEKVVTQPAPTRDEPKRAAPQTDVRKVESAPKRTTPEREKSKKDDAVRATQPKTKDPMILEPSRAKTPEVRTDAKPAKPPQVRSVPRTTGVGRPTPPPQVRQSEVRKQGVPSETRNKRNDVEGESRPEGTKGKK